MFKIIHGKISLTKLTLHCVIFNEMYYLPALLNHYRGLGVEQFIFVDDHSTDESVDFLAGESDTVIVRPQMRYGDLLNGKRAGPQWKTILPQTYLKTRWSLCVDADEFLVGQNLVLSEVIGRAEARGDAGIAAVMVDMYPAQLDALENTEKPETLSDLLQVYAWFDRGPYLEWAPGDLKPTVLCEGAAGRLLNQHGINTSDYSPTLLMRIQEIFVRRKKRSVFKVPLVKWSAERSYVNAHTLNCAPSTGEGLALLHFKFTSALQAKVKWAIERKSFNKGSRGYFAFQEMLMSAKAKDQGLLYEGSCRYENYNDLVLANIVPFGTPGQSTQLNDC